MHDRKFRAHSGFNYVQLDGNIGLLVGGAGLALATMDLLKLHQLEPANFLDLPPIATRQDVANACQTVLQAASVDALFVNAVGGGLTHCDTIAEGMIYRSHAGENSLPDYCSICWHKTRTWTDAAEELPGPH